MAKALLQAHSPQRVAKFERTNQITASEVIAQHRVPPPSPCSVTTLGALVLHIEMSTPMTQIP